MTIRNCQLTNPVASSAAIGNIGIYIGQSGLISNCDLNGHWTGARVQGSNPMFMGGRLETCCYGIMLNGLQTTSAGAVVKGIAGFTILNTEWEGCWGCGILVGELATTNQGAIIGCLGSANHGNATYGMYFGAVSDVTVIGTTCGGTVSITTRAGLSSGGYGNPSLAGVGTPAAIYIRDSSEPQRLTFISTSANNAPGTFDTANNHPCPAWGMPAHAVAARFVDCNNPPAIFTYANLPQSYTVTGQISNDGTATGTPPGTAGTVLQFTAGTFSPTWFTGAGVVSTTPGALAAGTVNNGIRVTGINQKTTVNIPQNTGSISMRVAPAVEGDEYMISDSSIGYTTTTTVLTPANPVSGQVLTMSTMGTPITAGGGTHRVKVRWTMDVANPSTGFLGTWIVA
jgi:hypothetical protein